MLRILVRLYLITIIAFSAAIYLIPDLVIKVFHERFLDYNLDQSRGLQSLIVKQFRALPAQQWPTLVKEMDEEFHPLQVALVRIDDPDFSDYERERLQRGEKVVRLGDWGWRTLAVSPLDEQLAVKLVVPPDPLDVNLLYWSINVLIVAVLLACLLLWVRPHWRDLERLKRTAERFGKGHLGERTQLPASSNIGSLANVFDTMAGDIEKLLNQQRDLLNAVSHELRTPLTRLDFGLALALSDDLPAASRERLQGWWRTFANWMNWYWSCCPTAACRTRRACRSRSRFPWTSSSTASWAVSTMSWSRISSSTSCCTVPWNVSPWTRG